MPGAAVRVVLTKWGDRPHWEFSATFLGSDDHGEWIGIPASTLMTRPGASFVPPVDSVVLVPKVGDWLATFYAPGFRVLVYVDVTTPPYWREDALCAVDLDLDVVRGDSGQVRVEDEDEFAEHRVALGYPDDVVMAASATCARVRAMVDGQTPPFDAATPARWLRLLRDSRQE
jgi:uncharacterized protein